MPDIDFQLLRISRRSAPRRPWPGTIFGGAANRPIPPHRAEPLAQWIEHFEPRVPLGHRRRPRSGPTGRRAAAGRPGPETASCRQVAGQCLVVGRHAVGRSLGRALRLSIALADGFATARLAAAGDRRGAAGELRPGKPSARRSSEPACRWCCGLGFASTRSTWTCGWQAYLASRSHNHRRQIRRLLNRAQDDMQLVVLDHLAPDDVETWLRCRASRSKTVAGRAAPAVRC